MSREVRKVPKDWVHPKNENGKYQPKLVGNYEEEFNEWLNERDQWKKGFQKDLANGGFEPKKEEYKDMSFEEYTGTAPDSRDYMPQWTEDQKTHYMMYETTSEGTPISPAFETPEKLAKWLVDNHASAFAWMEATYEQWLNMIKGPCFAPTAVMENGVLKSGIDDL